VPSRFICSSCGLHATVGWLHDASLDEGYGASARLLCRACGTEHAIRVALRDRGPERILHYDLTLAALEEAQRENALLILESRFDMSRAEANAALDSLPLTIARHANGTLARELAVMFAPVADVRVTEVDSIPNPAHGPLRRDRFLSAGRPRFDDQESFEDVLPRGPFRGANREFDLETQSCAHCGATGALLADEDAVGDHCPHCGNSTLECVERHDPDHE
jgi:predicted RNA-binding Zn-ribbon protein involved in translation (DUF1610 family)